MDQHQIPNSNQSDLEAAHEPPAIRARLESGPDSNYLKDAIYGAIDGAVTTFAVISGVAGAGLQESIIIILGIANLIGDGFSMAASNYLGTRAEEQLRLKLRHLEEEHIDRIPDGEREEVLQIMKKQGFKGKDLERAVDVITSDRDRWVEIMLREEHGVALSNPDPRKAALTTFLAFLIIGFLPLLPFVADVILPWSLPRPYLLSTVITSIAFFTVGAIKSRFVSQSWLTSGLETLAVGGAAAGLAYLCGVIVESLL